jgi:hypothetical protein
MKRSAESKKLRALESEAARIRKRLNISKVGEILYRAPQNKWSDNNVVVEADGSGGATLLIVEGNYPIDYHVHKEKAFSSEQEACDAADDIVEE